MNDKYKDVLEFVDAVCREVISNCEADLLRGLTNTHYTEGCKASYEHVSQMINREMKSIEQEVTENEF